MIRNRKTKSLNWFLIGLIALPIVAVGAYFWATGMISSLENYRSPLSNMPPVPGENLGAPITRRVVIVLLDALRYDTSTDKSVMPVLGLLRTDGAAAIMTSKPPSFSAPGWVTIFTGAWPEINDSQPLNPPDDYSARALTQDDIFCAADRAGLNTAVSGYIWFEKTLSNCALDTGFFTTEEDNAADQEVVSAALPWLRSNYQLVLIHIDQIDFAGHHEGGPLDQNWDAAASRADNLLAIIMAELDLESDTVIVLSDHGQIAKGGHGGNEPVTLLEPFIAIGKGIRPGIYEKINMVDIAPTVAVLLGMNIPASNQGRPLLEMLDISSDQSLVVLETLKIQQSNLLTTYAASIGQSAEDTTATNAVDVVNETQQAMERTRMARLAQERIWRNMVAIFLGIVPGYLLYLRKVKKFLWLITGVFVYLLIFAIRYLVVDSNSFGLSWIKGEMDLIIYIALTSGVALIVSWLVMMVGLRAFQNPPLPAAAFALGGIWMILYVLAIPILINFAINGIVVTWTLPQLTIEYLGFFAVLQVLFVSAVGIILVALSALVGKITKGRPLINSIKKVL